VERFWSCAKQPVNWECLKITVQIDTEISPLAFCWFIFIFISLVTVHVLSVGSELDTGFTLFCFGRHGGNFTVHNYYYDVSWSPGPAVWLSSAKWAYLKWLFLSRTKVKKTHIYWEVASKCNPNFETSKFLSRRKQAQDYMHSWQKRDFSRISDVWRVYANSRRHNNMIVISACCLEIFRSMGFSSK